MTAILRKKASPTTADEHNPPSDAAPQPTDHVDETASPVPKPSAENDMEGREVFTSSGTDIPDDADFSSFMDAQLPEPDTLAPGEKVKATVVAIGDEWVFLDIGLKSEGIVARTEFTDQNGVLAIHPGDQVDVFYLQAGKNGNRFTRRLGGIDTSITDLEEAFHGKIPVEGLVEEEIKGGYRVKVGKIRAFCPYSQIALKRHDEDSPVGSSLQFRVTEIRDHRKSVVVSRRILLEEEQRQRLAELRESLRAGQCVSGTITSVRDFGAFVDIGGLEGLIPAREISWDSSQAITEVLQPGDRVEVEILSLDWIKQRFAFSLKRAGVDPWNQVEGHFPVGTTASGSVSRLMPFGAFIRLTAGIEGLVHISRLGDRSLKHPKEALEVGQQLDVRIESIDLENRRLSLLPVDMTQLKHGGGKQEDSQDGSDEDIAAYLASLKERQTEESTMGALFKQAADKAKQKKT